MLDGSRTFLLAGDATLTPTVELGLRHDGGDAETGAGMELGAGVSYADPSRGLDMALRMHGLAGHSQDGYDEWGVSGTLRLVPGGSERGPDAVAHAVVRGGPERLRAAVDDAGRVGAGRERRRAPSSRLDTEVGYGLGAPGGPRCGDALCGAWAGRGRYAHLARGHALARRAHDELRSRRYAARERRRSGRARPDGGRRP